MIKFCSCGSLLVDDVCTNKNCSFHKSSPSKGNKQKGTKAIKVKTEKSTGKVKSDYDKARRSSRCVTYKLSDLGKKEDKP